MAAPFTKLDAPIHRLAMVCRGCLAESGEMKNMYEWGLSDDYFRITAIETTRKSGISELLCSNCESAMLTCKQFRDRCQLSDKILKTSLQVRNEKAAQKLKKNQVNCLLYDQKLVLLITAPDMEEKINLPCPFHCTDNFYKKSDLHTHLKKLHNVSNDFEIELQYYCDELNCSYHVTSDRNKWFSGRKFLNQHQNHVHKIKTYYCKDCGLSFATETEFRRHAKSCNCIYICQICNLEYSTNEKLMVHLLRKHPDLHKMYKDEKRAEKRKLNNGNESKKIKTEVVETLSVSKPRISETQVSETQISETQVSETQISETSIDGWGLSKSDTETKADEKSTKSSEMEFCNSPKKSFATQIPEDIKYDVTLPSWQSKEFETKTDEISTQTGFEDLLSIKSQNSEDEIFFSESVSLSDIQTQTFPLEFGLSGSKEKTCKNSQTQSPDLSMKETQTCFCHYDSPKPNFRLFESLSSSPGSLNLTSTETQTADHRFSVKSDVLLNFNSAETQTCFDDSSNDSM